MPIAHISSSEGKKIQKSSYRRRKDQNSEISELESLLPWSQKGSGIDKISVLRLTSAFMKYKDFWEAYGVSSSKKSGKQDVAVLSRLFTEALDGFLLVLSPTGEVIFVSEGVSDYVGITQQEVIGQSIYELTHEDDSNTIRDSLKPEGLRTQQHRHFYVRFKSSISPGKKQLSRYGGTVMLQVSGNLKLGYKKSQTRPEVIGLVAECRRIESSSIIELTIPQVMFTSTTTMDLKILSVDTKMNTITGFDIGDVEGSVITNYLHPADNRRSIHCLKTLLITGQAVSPIIRFMTHTGEWVWVQIQGLVRYEADNKTPKYLEASFKVVCASEGCIKMIEQTELYGKPDAVEEDAGIHADERFKVPTKSTVHGPQSIINAIENTDVSEAIRDVLLHGREEALSSIPKNLGRLASWGEVVDAVVEYETSKGLEPKYDCPYPIPENGSSSVIMPMSLSAVSDLSSLSHASSIPSSSKSTSTMSASPASVPTQSDVPSPLSDINQSPAVSSLNEYSPVVVTEADSTYKSSPSEQFVLQPSSVNPVLTQANMPYNNGYVHSYASPQPTWQGNNVVPFLPTGPDPYGLYPLYTGQEGIPGFSLMPQHPPPSNTMPQYPPKNYSFQPTGPPLPNQMVDGYMMNHMPSGNHVMMPVGITTPLMQPYIASVNIGQNHMSNGSSAFPCNIEGSIEINHTNVERSLPNKPHNTIGIVQNM